MLLKEIFSRKKKLFREILSQKLLNQTTYEKSYIRRASLELASVCLLDNCRSFFNTVKNIQQKKRKGRIKNFKALDLKPKKKKKKSKKKIEKKKETKVEKILRQQKAKAEHKRKRKIAARMKSREAKRKLDPYTKAIARIKRIGYKGSSCYTTTFLYRNRKINLIRFKQPICNLIRPINFINLFLKGLKTLLKGRIKRKDNTLIILEAKRGGFSCYSSGFRGFIPKRHFQCIVETWLKGIRHHALKIGNFTPLKQFVMSQSFQWCVSPPPRFRFSIKKLIQYHRFRRNKLNLSRKKKTEIPTKMVPKFIFSSPDKAFVERKKLRKQQQFKSEAPVGKYERITEDWAYAFKKPFKKHEAFKKR